MAVQINKNDIVLMTDLADHRMLSLSQIAVLYFGSKRSARRRMQQLAETGVVEVLPVGRHSGSGRPEKVFGLSGRGHSELVSQKVLSEQIHFDQVAGTSLLPQAEHQLLLNWCRIHLIHLTREVDRIKLSFLSCNSPFALDDTHAIPLIKNSVLLPGEETSDSFTPDAAFTLNDTVQSKTVLFFLEVDRGTEPRETINQKVIRYQQYFRSQGYKRYEEIMNVSIRGFRLLFMADSSSRRDALCSAVIAIPPSDFVWVSSQDLMFAEGVSGDIWTKGGDREQGLQSILGSISKPALIPALNTQ